jgi:hypothetical protein
MLLATASQCSNTVLSLLLGALNMAVNSGQLDVITYVSLSQSIMQHNKAPPQHHKGQQQHTKAPPQHHKALTKVPHRYLVACGVALDPLMLSITDRAFKRVSPVEGTAYKPANPIKRVDITDIADTADTDIADIANIADAAYAAQSTDSVIPTTSTDASFINLSGRGGRRRR